MKSQKMMLAEMRLSSFIEFPLVYQKKTLPSALIEIRTDNSMIRVGFIALVCLISLSNLSYADSHLKSVKVAVLKFGTVMWELETIKRYGLDTRHNFKLEIQPVANKQAAAVMLQADETDAIVSDWIWAARQWDVRPFVVLPYSRSVGGVMIKGEGIKTIADLKGKRIAIAGGPLDKNWIMLQAVALSQYGFNLAESADVVFAAPPLIHRKMLDGEFDAEINFWPYLARSKAKGLKFLTTTKQLSSSANLSAEVPLLAYVFKQDWAAENPDLVRSFFLSSQEAKTLLQQDEAAWLALKSTMKVNNEHEFVALRDGFIEGIPSSKDWPHISKMLSWITFLRNNGGEKLVGTSKTLAPEMFLSINE
ncbi:MAG: ABC transporter substrate-binding protein [Sneathiella sp.]